MTTSSAESILRILDACAEALTFPALDNGYLYLAASRLSVFASEVDWALVIEVFGHSPRAGDPDLQVHAFSSRLRDRRTRSDFVSDDAFSNYLANNPHNESRFVFPVAGGQWDETAEYVAREACVVVVRETEVAIPAVEDLTAADIVLEDPSRLHVFELCRYLAARHRPLVLATPSEQAANLSVDLHKVLEIDEWAHPDISAGELPSDCETFQQLARVMSSGHTHWYRPTLAPNSHWRYWPDGGRL